MDFDRSSSAPVLHQAEATEADTETEDLGGFPFGFGSEETSEFEAETDGFFPPKPHFSRQLKSDNWWTKIGIACGKVADICGDTDGSKDKTLAETLSAVNSMVDTLQTQSVPQLTLLCSEMTTLITTAKAVVNGHGNQLGRNLSGSVPFVMTTVGFALFESVIPSETSFLLRLPMELMWLVLIVHFFLLIVK